MNRVGGGRNAVWGGCEESLINAHFQSVSFSVSRRQPVGASSATGCVRRPGRPPAAMAAAGAEGGGREVDERRGKQHLLWLCQAVHAAAPAPPLPALRAAVLQRVLCAALASDARTDGSWRAAAPR
eukprot:COSAG03_NODE_4372_length_1572_cov_1.537678_2_plen_126_part_00